MVRGRFCRQILHHNIIDYDFDCDSPLGVYTNPLMTSPQYQYLLHLPPLPLWLRSAPGMLMHDNLV